MFTVAEKKKYKINKEDFLKNLQGTNEGIIDKVICLSFNSNEILIKWPYVYKEVKKEIPSIKNIKQILKRVNPEYVNFEKDLFEGNNVCKEINYTDVILSTNTEYSNLIMNASFEKQIFIFEHYRLFNNTIIAVQMLPSINIILQYYTTSFLLKFVCYDHSEQVQIEIYPDHCKYPAKYCCCTNMCLALDYFNIKRSQILDYCKFRKNYFVDFFYYLIIDYFNNYKLFESKIFKKVFEFL
jgi:hypothetical protein